MNKERAKKLFEIGLFAWAYLHLFAIIIWSLPSSPAELRIGYARKNTRQQIVELPWRLLYFNNRYLRSDLIEDYLRVTGLQQNWNMFAPYPITQDVWIDGIVRLKDGTEKTVAYPRGSRMGIVERFIKERYWKFIETAQNEDNAILWPALSAYLAREARSTPGNPVINIDLYRHYRQVMPPGMPQPTDFKSEIFYSTPVVPGDLFPS